MAVGFKQNRRLPLQIAIGFLGILSLLAAVLLTPKVSSDRLSLLLLFGLLIGISRGVQNRMTVGQRSMAGLALVIPVMVLFGPEYVFWSVVIGLIFSDFLFGVKIFWKDSQFRRTFLFSLCTLPITATAGSIFYYQFGGGQVFGFDLLLSALGGIIVYLILFINLTGAINTLVWKPADPQNLAETPTFTHNDSVTLLSMSVLGLMNSFLLTQNLFGGLILASVMTLLTGQYTQIASYSKQLYLGIINALMVLIEFRDPYTKGHSDRVATYSVHIARVLGLSERECDDIYHAALLHDLGKTGVSQKILHKPGSLTKREFARIKEHAEISSRIIGQIDYRGKIHKLVRSHHERFDGRGYPDGLSGLEIPLGARIIAIADAFDAMTSLRPYRKSFTIRQALEEIETSAGTQLDPDIVPKAISILSRLSSNFSLQLEADDFPMRGASTPLRKSFWEGDNSLLNRVDRSEFLDNISVCGVLHFADGQFTTDFPRKCFEQEVAFDALKSLAEKSWDSASQLEDVFVTSDEGIFHCTAIPRDKGVDLVVLDSTKVLKVEESHLEQVETAYSQVLNLITGGKFHLLAEEQLPEYVSGKQLRNVALESVETVPQVLAAVNDLFVQMSLDQQRAETLLLCVSEAVMNVFKHGSKGHLCIVSVADKIRVVVADNGNGLDIRSLPDILFKMEGPGRLRRGLALMLKCLDNVALCTGSNGTTLILEEKVT